MFLENGLCNLISKYQNYPEYCKYSNLSESERYAFIREYLSILSPKNAGEVISDAIADNQHFFSCYFQAICEKQKKPDELLNIILACVDDLMRGAFERWFELIEEKTRHEINEWQRIEMQTAPELRDRL